MSNTCVIKRLAFLNLGFIDLLPCTILPGALHNLASFSFFLCWVSKTQPNHWTKRMANTRLTRSCPGPEDLSIT